MRTKLYAMSFVSAMLIAGGAVAETTEEMCLRVSEEWGSTGDVAGQCACLADLASADQSLSDELHALAAAYTNDADAYEAASDGGKAALDQCAVET